MNFVAAVCPNCGANIHVDEERERGFCQYCGTEIIIQDAIQKVKITGPVEIFGTVNIKDNEFESKLALAENMEKIFFMSGPNAVAKNGKTGYDAVLEFYGDAERIGGNQTAYWLALARFYEKGILYSLRTGSRYLKNRQLVINFYILYIDNAIKFCKSGKEEIENEKNRTLPLFISELNKFPETDKNPPQKAGCYIASAVYGSYDCPEVWTLRRYRDHTLSRTWLGRAFIRIYYRISPKLVKAFGNTSWFTRIARRKLDPFVASLWRDGVLRSPYEDQPRTKTSLRLAFTKTPLSFDRAHGDPANDKLG